MAAIDLCRQKMWHIGCLIAVVMATAVLWVTSAAANPCAGSSIVDCQAQPQAGVTYSGWATKGWAYYCTGDHLYYCSGVEGKCVGAIRSGYEFNNHCFSIAENTNYETNSTKFDATITNWCAKKETLVITLACSDKLDTSPSTILEPASNR
jgi:hypothetical protein